MIDRTTAPIPTLHTLVASQTALRQAVEADTDNHYYERPYTSQRTLRAWWRMLEALWLDRMEEAR